jgi:large subunit ribosomal protein L30
MESNPNDKNSLVAAVRIRGHVGVRVDIEETLKRLNLKRPNNCVLLRPSAGYLGMLKKAANYIAYGEIDGDTLSKLVRRHAPGSADTISNGTIKDADLKKLMPLRLHPPRHGFRSVRRGFSQKGSLGYMGKEINALVSRMV